MADYSRLMRHQALLSETPPPHLEEGMWIRWTTQDRIWEGQIVELIGPGTRLVWDPILETHEEVDTWPAISIRWLGSVEELQTFPSIEGYFPPRGTGMEVIPKPRSADRIARDAKAGIMTVKRAASLLGVEPKRVRAMLRGGLLRGHQEKGKWIAVNGEDVMAKLND